MITQSITQNQFVNAFRECGREDQFSYDALNELFGYYYDLSEDSGEEFDLDVIAICCEWSEYDNALEAGQAYEPEGWKAMTEDDANESALNWLRDRTQVIELSSGGVIITDF